MNDLISRQDAIEAIQKLSNVGIHWFVAATLVSNTLLKLPSVQPEITRCKDCKYLTKIRSKESARRFGQIYECRCGVVINPKSYDFCSRAERKNDE